MFVDAKWAELVSGNNRITNQIKVTRIFIERFNQQFVIKFREFVCEGSIGPFGFLACFLLHCSLVELFFARELIQDDKRVHVVLVVLVDHEVATVDCDGADQRVYVGVGQRPCFRLVFFLGACISSGSRIRDSYTSRLTGGV